MTSKISDPQLQMALQKSKIRFDIQALRAFSVLLVVLYHIPWNGLQSFSKHWWIGVDFFFVISGYLILGILIRQRIETGQILVAPFLQKRALRLIPSTVAVVSLSSILLWLATRSTLFAALEFRDAAASFISMENFYLIFKSEDYLASDQLSSPFTHFWSLGVEEQFYLLAALALALAFKSKRMPPEHVLKISLLIFAAAALLGLFVSDALREVNSAAAYFNPIARIWEFSIGGFAAAVGIWLKARGVNISYKLGQFVGYSVYLTIAILITFGGMFDLGWGYPGYEIAPVLFVLAMAMAVSSFPDESVTTLRARAPVRRAILFLGKRSYVIYLWHFPLIFLFSNVLQLDGLALFICAVIATMGLAALTGWAVEDRFRYAAPDVRNLGLLCIAITIPFVTSLSLAGFSTIHLKETAANMESIAASQMAQPGSMTTALGNDNSWAYYSIPEMYESGCHSDFGSSAKLCLFGTTGSQAIRIALVGDSHATQLAPGLKLAAEGFGATLFTLLQSSCSLDSGYVASSAVLSEKTTSYIKKCEKFTKSSLTFLKRIQPDVLILAAASLPRPIASASANGSSHATIEMLDHLQAILPGSQIVVFEDPPRASVLSNLDVFYCATRSMDEECPEAPKVSAFWDRLTEVARLKGLAVLSIRTELCASGTCKKSVDGIPVYRDSNHLNAAYSMRLAPYWTSLMEDWSVEASK